MSESERDDRDPGRAIITYGRGWQTLAATRSLGSRGVEVITGDEYALTYSSFSKYSVHDFRYPDPTLNPGEFLDTLERTVIEHKPEDPGVPYVLMPIHKETYLIARHRERFERHCRVPIPDLAHIEAVHNKGTLAAHAEEEGLPIPRTWRPKSLEELRAQVTDIGLPAFVKLRESAAGVGIRKVDSAEEIVATFTEFCDKYGVGAPDLPIVQEGVPGDDYCVTTLFDAGRLVACMTYRNIRQFPAEKGAGVLRETVEAKAMERVVAELLGPLGWHGVAEIDFRWTGKPDDTPYLIEVNPRFWGGLNQAIESGWDYPWLLYRLAVDGHVDPPGEGSYGVRTETPLLGLLATLQEVTERGPRMDALEEAWRRAKRVRSEHGKRAALKEVFSGLKEYIDIKGRAREAKALLEIHKNNVFDVLSRDDPLPALGVFYPLAVFLKHGKVNMELLTGESGPGESRPEHETEPS